MTDDGPDGHDDLLAAKTSWRPCSRHSVPTYEVTETFVRGHDDPTLEQRLAFRRALAHFVGDGSQGTFRRSLRVKGIQGMPGCFEMTWAGAGTDARSSPAAPRFMRASAM